MTRLTYEEDTEPYARKRDRAVQAAMAEAGVEVLTCPTHTLYDTNK